MKTVKKVVLLTLMMVMGFVAAQAQETTSTTAQELTPVEKYFVGKWKLMVYGLPQGDATMLLVIEKKDGKYSGTIGGENGENPSKLTKVEIKGKTLNVRFMGGGWDVPLYLDYKDEKSSTGSMNDMFDVEASKIIEEKK